MRLVGQWALSNLGGREETAIRTAGDKEGGRALSKK